MEPQKNPTTSSQQQQPEIQHEESHDHDEHPYHHDQHHHSTTHLFNPDSRKLTPYSLYLMNNNWHAGLDAEADPELKWTWPDYLCGVLAGILLFIGLGLTELVNQYWGKTAVAIYLVIFIVLFFAFVTQLFIRRRN